MPEGPFGGPRPFSDVKSELMIRFEGPVDREKQDEVIEELRLSAQSLSKLSEPVSLIGGPNNDVALIKWTSERVTETDLKSYRKTMNENLPGTEQIKMLSVTLDKK